MNIEEAKGAVGAMVMSRDAGTKCIKEVRKPHGPYLLKQVTKGGLAIIVTPSGDFSVPPTLLSLPSNDQPLGPA